MRWMYYAYWALNVELDLGSFWTCSVFALCATRTTQFWCVFFCWLAVAHSSLTKFQFLFVSSVFLPKSRKRWPKQSSNNMLIGRGLHSQLKPIYHTHSTVASKKKMSFFRFPLLWSVVPPHVNDFANFFRHLFLNVEFPTLDFGTVLFATLFFLCSKEDRRRRKWEAIWSKSKAQIQVLLCSLMPGNFITISPWMSERIEQKRGKIPLNGIFEDSHLVFLCN